MMTMELFSRESLTTDFYITALFLVHTCLLTTWTKRLDQLCNGSVAVKHNRHIESGEHDQLTSRKCDNMLIILCMC